MRANILFQWRNSMSIILEQNVEVSTEVLMKGFLKALNMENLINNKTYIESVKNLQKGEVKKDVNQK